MVKQLTAAQESYEKGALGKNIKFWGCFSAFGVGNIVKIEGNITGQKYREILNDNLEKSIEKMEIEEEFERNEIRIIQDNDSKHQSKIGKEYFSEKPFKTFPPSSHDLNPIEHLWAFLKREVDRKKPNNLEELWDFVGKEWDNLKIDFLKNLVHSMPNRLEEVIRAEGYSTNY